MVGKSCCDMQIAIYMCLFWHLRHHFDFFTDHSCFWSFHCWFLKFSALLYHFCFGLTGIDNYEILQMVRCVEVLIFWLQTVTLDINNISPAFIVWTTSSLAEVSGCSWDTKLSTERIVFTDWTILFSLNAPITGFLTISECWRCIPQTFDKPRVRLIIK